MLSNCSPWLKVNRVRLQVRVANTWHTCEVRFSCFFERENFAITMAALKMFVARVPDPPIGTTVHTFIEIVNRILRCHLNKLFIGQILNKSSHRHTLLLVLLWDDGAAWSKGRISLRIAVGSSGLGEHLEICCGLSSSSTLIIVGVVHFHFLVPDPWPVIGRVFERSTEAS